MYAFHWNCKLKFFHYLTSLHQLLYSTDYHNATTLLDPEDLFTGLVGPYDQKSQGVIMWGSTSELEDTAFIEARVYLVSLLPRL